MRSTFILMLLFMGLGTVAIFDPLHFKQKREESKQQEQHLFWWKDAKVTNLSIQAKEGSFDLGCDAASGCSMDSMGNWHLQRPIVEVADDSAVGALLNSLKNTQVVETIDLEDPGKFGEYGLDAPDAQISFHLAGDANTHFLKIGKSTAIGPNLYALSSERQKVIVIIPEVFTNVLKGGLFHWRNKRLFPELGVNELEHFSWSNFDFVKEKNDWLLKKPLSVKADSAMAGSMASTLIYLNAKTVVSENQQTPEALKIIKGKPVLKMELGAAKQKEYSLELFPPATSGGDYFVRASDKPGIYTIDAANMSRFFKTLYEYREHKLLAASDRSMIDKVEFRFPRDKQSIQFERKSGAWVALPPADGKAKYAEERINAFLDTLAKAEVESFVKKSAAKLVDLEITITMGKEHRDFHFSLDGKQNVLLDGEIPSEQRRFGLDVLRFLPVRMADLLESNNKKVITSEANGKHP